MEDDNIRATSGGISFCSVLFIVFLILKLCNVINWSWWWVTTPLWVPVALGIIVFVVYFIVLFIKELITNRR